MAALPTPWPDAPAMRPRDESFGALVRRCRQAHSWSQERLAEAADIEVGTVRRIEAGRRRVRPSMMAALGSALGMEAEVAAFLAAAAREEEEAEPVAVPVPMPSGQDFGALLRRYRLRSGHSQSSLAKIVGLNPHASYVGGVPSPSATGRRSGRSRCAGHASPSRVARSASLRGCEAGIRQFQPRLQDTTSRAFTLLVIYYSIVSISQGDMMVEEWRPVVGYEGLYEVSSEGRVKRVARGKGTRIGRILRTQRHPQGYRMVTLTIVGKQDQLLVHRVMAAAFFPRPLPGFDHVNHKDRCKDHNVVSNLEYTTRSGNVQHAIETGLIKTGERHYAARLTAVQVREIRATWERRDGSQSEIAVRYGVSRGAIVGIIYGKNWKQLREEPMSYGPR